MSAFNVNRQTIHDVVQAFVRRMPVNSAGKTPDEIGAHLIRMNAEAVRQRYAHMPEMVAECAAHDAAAETYSFVEPKHLTAAQMLTSARCLRYQCSEGNVDTTWPAFRDLNMLTERMVDDGFETVDGEWDRATDGPVDAEQVDFRAENHGSLYLLHPLNEAARTHLKENVDAEAVWTGGAVAVEPRYLENLRLALEEHGFTTVFA